MDKSSQAGKYEDLYGHGGSPYNAFFALMVHQEDSAAFFLLLWLAAGTGEVG